jgi:5'-nucleotidase
MKLLLTNDDGYNAEGINILAQHLLHDNDVCVFAPDRNRSAVSHCITMNEPLKIIQRSERVYSCSGVPVDCVVAGIRGNFLPFMPDAVISGINRGANVGTDIVYSGTAAAARQAVLYGVPGIALSVESQNDIWKYDAMADFAAKNIHQLVSLSCVAGNSIEKSIKQCIFVNVNALSDDSYKGVCFADELSFREYRDTVKMINAPDGCNYSFFCGGSIISHGGIGCDFAACSKGYIVVSRIYAEPQSAGVVDGITFSL